MCNFIQGDRKLHQSCINKTNRVHPYSYLSVLVKSAYFVGSQGTNWDYLMKILNADPNINQVAPMHGGGENTRYDSDICGGNRCGGDTCGGTSYDNIVHFKGGGNNKYEQIYLDNKNRYVDLVKIKIY